MIRSAAAERKIRCAERSTAIRIAWSSIGGLLGRWSRASKARKLGPPRTTLGQIEQVVSSADCRTAEQTRAGDHANHTENRDCGAAGTLSALGQSAELLEL